MIRNIAGQGAIQQTMKKFGTSWLVLVGCLVGVGLLSGTEVLLYLPNKLSVAIFALAFCAILAWLLKFCQSNDVFSLHQLCKRCFGKLANAVEWLVVLCNFVCIVCGLSATCNTLRSLFPLPYPTLEIALCAVAIVVLCNASKILPVANALSVVVAICLCLCLPKSQNVVENVDTTALVVYTLFSVAMVVPVVGKVGKTCKQTILSATVATAVFCIVALLVQSRCSFGGTPILLATTPMQKALFCTSICLASTTCLVANATPVCQYLQDLLPNTPLLATVVFCFATVLSTAGLDKIFALCYPFVGLVGALFLVATVTKKDCKKCNLSS